MSICASCSSTTTISVNFSCIRLASSSLLPSNVSPNANKQFLAVIHPHSLAQRTVIMWFGRVFLAVLGVIPICLATAPVGDYVVHERRTMPARRWVKRDRVPGDHSVSMTIALAQRNLDRGHDLLMEISHPDSLKYGQHLTHTEIVEIFAPSGEAIVAVHNWLYDSGVPTDRITLSRDRTRIVVNSYITEAEDLLRAQYHMFEHRDTGRVDIASEAYHLPRNIQRHVEFVTPGTIPIGSGRARSDDSPADGLERRHLNFPGSPRRQNLTEANVKTIKSGPLKCCDEFITPPCIKAMYNITDNTCDVDHVDPGNRLGIFEFGDFYSAASLTLFFTLVGPFQKPPIPPTEQPKVELIDGAKIPPATGIPTMGTESDLDLQISYPIIYPQGATVYQSDDNVYTMNLSVGSDATPWGGNGFLNNIFNAFDKDYCASITSDELANDPQYPHHVSGPFESFAYNHPLQCGTLKPPNVLSISYGEQEYDLPKSYQKRQCNEFMKLGLAGTTVVVATGEVFNPDYPATCPYITAVGATYLPSGASAEADEEVAVTAFPSGGGFSNVYKRPDWQDPAVNTYLNDHKPSYESYAFDPNYETGPAGDGYDFKGGIFNRGGRGYPDVSAVGDNVFIFADGVPTLIGGTSASAPVFAAIITRINEERLKAKKSTVGFVNPVLYKNPQAFHDITTGSNPGCNTNGFNVSKGWDPVTGLGTPDYTKLLEVFKNLP
ncbi:Subtilisin-like protein [Mycena venus]|uniref:Subtilisin-like protein n=1 Tax=Mycena venus TaxID=2733690 RepID=A0A8H6U3J4_9AGAR|nr:Subtilisin-like protein [Mycena venus]